MIYFAGRQGGDIDFSYDFHFFKQGKIIRQYIVKDEEINKPYVHIDEGDAVVGEGDCLGADMKEPIHKMLRLAKRISIVYPADYDQIKLYERVETSTLLQNKFST